MTTASAIAPAARAPLSPLRAVLYGALVVGSCDIAWAIVYWAFRGSTPTRIFQSIAAGLLGRAALRGGIPTALLGAVLHYFIAFSIVALYWFASRGWKALLRHPLAYGAIYGLGVYGFMNFVVIPLSAAARGRFIPVWTIGTIIVHVLFIGIPAALFARAAD